MLSEEKSFLRGSLQIVCRQLLTRGRRSPWHVVSPGEGTAPTPGEYSGTASRSVARVLRGVRRLRVNRKAQGTLPQDTRPPLATLL